MTAPPLPNSTPRTVGVFGVFVAGVSLVVSSSTLVTEFAGFTSLGAGFAASLVLGFLIILPLALVVADLTVSHPFAGGIYHLTRAVLGRRGGSWIGMLLALGFIGTFLFGAAGETMAGAHALKSLTGLGFPVRIFALSIAAFALAAGCLPLQRLTHLAGALLVLMLSIRWLFGLAGFLGWSEAGDWSAENLGSGDGILWTGSSGLIASGLAFGFWTFVGIEGAGALAGETRDPRRSLPRGMVLGLVAILATSAFMGLGTLGSFPLAVWQEAVNGTPGDHGESPQLAVGELMFGPLGRHLMAAASLASSLSTLVVAFAAVSRMVHAMARDGLVLGPLSNAFSRLHARTGAPVNALFLVGGLYLGVIACTGAVIDCLYAAAYLWFFRYFVLYALAIVNRVRRRAPDGILPRPLLLATAVAGAALTFAAFKFGFQGSHLLHASRALVVVAGAAVLTLLAFAASRRPSRPDADHSRQRNAAVSISLPGVRSAS